MSFKKRALSISTAALIALTSLTGCYGGYCDIHECDYEVCGCDKYEDELYIDDIYDDDTSISGYAPIGSKIYIYNGSRLLNTGTTPVSGRYYIRIPRQSSTSKLKVVMEHGNDKKTKSTSVLQSNSSKKSTTNNNTTSNKNSITNGKTNNNTNSKSNSNTKSTTNGTTKKSSTVTLKKPSSTSGTYRVKSNTGIKSSIPRTSTTIKSPSTTRVKIR